MHNMSMDCLHSSDFSSKFQSSMTIFHHKLLTREIRVLADEWIRPSSKKYICSLIQKISHPKSYHSGIKYHTTLNIIFNVATLQYCPWFYWLPNAFSPSRGESEEDSSITLTWYRWRMLKDGSELPIVPTKKASEKHKHGERLWTHQLKQNLLPLYWKLWTESLFIKQWLYANNIPNM